MNYSRHRLSYIISTDSCVINHHSEEEKPIFIHVPILNVWRNECFDVVYLPSSCNLVTKWITYCFLSIEVVTD